MQGDKTYKRVFVELRVKQLRLKITRDLEALNQYNLIMQEMANNDSVIINSSVLNRLNQRA